MKSLGTIPSLGLVNVSGMSKKSQEAAPKCLSLQTFRRWVMIQVTIIPFRDRDSFQQWYWAVSSGRTI